MSTLCVSDEEQGQTWTVDMKRGHQVRERLFANCGIIGIERVAVKRGATIHF